MSDKLTRIKVPGRLYSESWMEWGEKTAEEMIAAYRSYADHWREIVKAIDDTPDEGFYIDVIRGPAVQRLVKVLQDPAKKSE